MFTRKRVRAHVASVVYDPVYWTNLFSHELLRINLLRSATASDASNHTHLRTKTNRVYLQPNGRRGWL